MSTVTKLKPKARLAIAPPLSQHENARLERFEAVTYHRNHAAAGALLLELLRQLRAGAAYIGHTQDDARLAQLHTRAAAAAGALLADPGFGLSAEGFAQLATEHEGLQALAEASGFDTLDHATSALLKNPEELDPRQFDFLDGNARAKFLLAHCTNSPRGFDLVGACAGAPQGMLPLYLGLVAQRVNLHPAAHAAREALLGAHEQFKGLTLPDGLLAPLADAYMYCSYGVNPARHEVKATLSGLMAGLVRQHCQLPTAAELALRRKRRNHTHLVEGADWKPTLLMPIEWLGSFHAMYRCYAPSIAQLRPYFRLVASCKEEVLDAKARELFDDFLWLPKDSVILADVVRRVNALAPDAIYYPSVGMALWWVALAQVRLAPIQLFTLGHPATTRSPAMDYVIAEEGQADPELFSERVLELPLNAIQFVDRPDTDAALAAALPRRAAGEKDPPVLRVAVNSMIVKVTAPFAELLRRVEVRCKEYWTNPENGEWERAPRIEFHFFPSVIGVVRAAARRQLQRWLPGCVVHDRADYVGYMSALAACHLHLSTFPFGGTNTLVDSMMLGIPIVCLEGREPHEKFDALMLRRVGLSGLIARTPQEYEDKAVTALTDSHQRVLLAELLMYYDVRGEFCAPRTGHAAGAFGRAVRHAFEHHERYGEAQGHVVPWQDFTLPNGASDE